MSDFLQVPSDTLLIQIIPVCLLHFFSAVLLAVIVRQRKPYRRKDGTTLYFEGVLRIHKEF